jgi:hypothetical protein
MIRSALATVLLAASVSARARPVPASPAGMSQDAKTALAKWHQCFPGVFPGYFGVGSRRFAGSDLSWRAEPSLRASALTAMAYVQGYLTRAVASIHEVPITDASAKISFRVGSSITVPGLGVVPVGNGCVTFPTMAADKVTYSSIEIVCHSADQAGATLLTHEVWWHAFFSPCHTASGCGAIDPSNSSPLSECVVGQAEAARWIYSVPAGTFPPR